MAKSILTLEEKFMLHVEPEPMSGCWLWTGGLSVSGYGKFYVGESKYTLAHRWSFAWLRESIPEGDCVLHRCDVRVCVNPDHLFIGDRQVNASDMALKERGCKSERGLPYGAHLLSHARRDSSRWTKLYQARMRHRDKLVSLGTFATAEEASAVAVEWRNRIHSEEMK